MLYADEKYSFSEGSIDGDTGIKSVGLAEDIYIDLAKDSLFAKSTLLTSSSLLRTSTYLVIGLYKRDKDYQWQIVYKGNSILKYSCHSMVLHRDTFECWTFGIYWAARHNHAT